MYIVCLVCGVLATFLLGRGVGLVFFSIVDRLEERVCVDS